MSAVPPFRVGDRVIYELARSGLSRWCMDRDYGGSGQWEEGEVISVDYKRVTVMFNNVRPTTWPLPGDSKYDSNQWQRPGYIRLKSAVSSVANSTTAEKRCCCGAEAVYGPGCGTHAHWCDLAQST